MIEMAVRDENIYVADALVLDEIESKWAQSRASIENQNMITTADFDAGRVAAITNCRWTGAGDASSDTPKPNPHRRF
jgi:hypothetical protein